MKGCKSQFKNRKLLGFSSGSGSPTGSLPFPEKVPRGEMMWEEPSQLIPFASLEMIGRAPANTHSEKVKTHKKQCVCVCVRE